MDCIITYLFGIFFVFVVYIISLGSGNLFPKNGNDEFSTSSAFMILFSFVAAVLTGGISVHAIFLFPFIVFLVFRNQKLLFSSFSWINFLLFTAFYSVLFCLSLLCFTDMGTPKFKVYNDVYAYLSEISLLKHFGIETNFIELENKYFGENMGIFPYHFLDFWPCALISKLSTVRLFLIYHLFLIPFLGSIILFGAFNFLRNTSGRIFVSFFGALALLLTLRFSVLDELIFEGMKLLGLENLKIYKAVFFQNYGSWHFLSYLHGIKQSISAIFIFPIVIHALRKNWNYTLFYLCIISIASVSYIPFALAFSSLIIVRAIIEKKAVLKFFLPFASILLLWVFYKIFGSNLQTGNSKFNLLEIITVPGKSGTSLKTQVFTAISYIWETYYWLFFLVALFTLFSNIKRSLKFFAITLILYPLIHLQYDLLFKPYLVLVLFALFYNLANTQFRQHLPKLAEVGGTLIILSVFLLFFGQIYDIFQIKSLIEPSLIYGLCLFLIAVLAQKISFSGIRIISSILVFWVILECNGILIENRRTNTDISADWSFYQKVQNFVAKNDLRTAYLSEFNLFPFLHYSRLGVEFLNFRDNFQTTCLSVFDLTESQINTLDKIGAGILVKRFPFYSYCQKKSPNGAISIPELQRQFLIDKKINVLFRSATYPRKTMSFANGLLVDSSFNKLGNYWAYMLKTK
jgi:hypothetical protein